MLHSCKDIHYLVMANIVMCNMMVKEHLHSPEQESNKFYKAGDVDTDEKSLVESAMDYDVCND